jgi:hypothetical protein
MLTQEVTLPIFIREVPGSNVVRDTDNPIDGFRTVTQSLPENGGIVVQIFHG